MRAGSALSRLSGPRLAFAGLFAVTFLSILSVGATLTILPRYIQGPMGGGDVAVGIVTGAFAITGLACRPLAGTFADSRGRRPVMVVGALLMTVSSLLLFVPAGIAGLFAARLLLGAGEGMVFTAGAAWVVDITPVARRGRILGLYGLAIWSGLSFGPPAGELILRATDFEAVWAFAAITPFIAALLASRIRQPRVVRRQLRSIRDGFFAREALGPGAALSLATVGYAALAAFVVLHLDERGIGHGAEVFTVFAVSVVATRLLLGWLPDRYGPARCASVAALVEAVGLLLIATAASPAPAIVGAVMMGIAFSTIFPSLALLVVNHVGEDRRGIAMGTYTACFDIGLGIGAPLCGIAAALAGYGASFAVATAAALAATAVSILLGRRTVERAPMPG